MAKLEFSVMADISEIEGLIDEIKHLQTYKMSTGDEQVLVDRDDVTRIFADHVKAKIKPECNVGLWIPIKWHECTDEDREKYGFSNDIAAVFDCEMPDDNQFILVTTSHGYVNQDVCYIDDGYSLYSGWDWIEDIVAWMPLPEPYREERIDE